MLRSVGWKERSEETEGRLLIIRVEGMCEEPNEELNGCERSERKVEELFLNSLISMLLSLRSKMPPLC